MTSLQHQPAPDLQHCSSHMCLAAAKASAFPAALPLRRGWDGVLLTSPLAVHIMLGLAAPRAGSRELSCLHSRLC